MDVQDRRVLAGRDGELDGGLNRVGVLLRVDLRDDLGPVAAEDIENAAVLPVMA